MNEKLIVLKIKELDNAIVKLLFKHYFSDKFFKSFSLTQMQVVNYILKSESKVYQKDLEKYLGLTRATTSGVLKTMEKHGLIEKITNSNDARSKEIVLNKKTKEIFSKSKEKFKDMENIVINGISKEELDIFSNIINKMNSNIKNYNSNERR